MKLFKSIRVILQQKCRHQVKLQDCRRGKDEHGTQRRFRKSYLLDGWIERFMEYKPLTKDEFYKISVEEISAALVGAEYFN